MAGPYGPAIGVSIEAVSGGLGYSTQGQNIATIDFVQYLGQRGIDSGEATEDTFVTGNDGEGMVTGEVAGGQ